MCGWLGLFACNKGKEVSKRATSTRLPRLVSLVVVLLIALLGVGCGGNDEQALPTATVSGESSTPSESVLDSPIATPVVGPLEWEATPEAGKANLRGQLLITEQTALVGELYLAAAVPTSDPDIYLLELDEKNSPRALFDRTTGDFVFLNIEPGKYGLIVWEPMQSAPLADSETGATLYIDLSADQVHDVGTLYFPHP